LSSLISRNAAGVTRPRRDQSVPRHGQPLHALRRIGRFRLIATASSVEVFPPPVAPQLMWKYTAAMEWSKEAGLKWR